MPTPTQILKHEHRIIERALHALDGMCQKLEHSEPVPPQALSQVVDFIRIFADGCHHKKEETHLFPTLERNGVPREGGPVGMMLYEHEMGRALVAEMDQAAKAYQAGDAEAADRFVQAGRRYIQLLTQHIFKEDNILFRIAEEALDDPTMISLEKAFEEIEAETGPLTHEQYERIAEEMEKAWAA